MVEYIDTGICGAPAPMATFLASLGWRPAGDEAVQLPAHIAGFTPLRVAEVAGLPVWFMLVRSTEALTLPAGVTVAPQWMTDSAVGGFAGVPSRTISAVAFLERFTSAEQAALYAADPRLIAGAIKVSTQGTANLDSQDARNLMALAVAKGALTQARAAEILA